MNDHRSVVPVRTRHRTNSRPEEEQMGHESDRAASDEEPDQGMDEQSAPRTEDADSLLQELVAYLRENRTELREEWARRISEAQLLSVMSDEEIFS